jgi:hypothetical protein
LEINEFVATRYKKNFGITVAKTITKKQKTKKKILNKLATFGDASPVCYYLGLFHVAKL